MKEIKLTRTFYKRVAIILLVTILLSFFLVLIFGYISLKRGNQYVAMYISFKNNVLAQNVKRDYPRIDGEKMEYDFQIILDRYTETESEYKIIALPYGYEKNFSTVEEAKFEYSLDKTKGVFNFTEEDRNNPFTITLTYKLDKDIRYLFEYSFCSFNKVFSNLLKIDTPCGKGECVVNRNIYSWTIEKMSKGFEENTKFFESYDQDSLIRGLFNFFIVNDFGYYKPWVYKASSVQTSDSTDAYRFSSDFIQNKEDGLDLNLIWVLSTTAQIINKDYDKYENIDLNEYLESLSSIWNGKMENENFLSCEMANVIITNLNNCESEACTQIKEDSYNYCKNIVERDVEGHENDSTASDLPSELVFYNRNTKLMNKENKIYTESEIVGYFKDLESKYGENREVINNCHQLKSINEMYSEYGDSEYREIQSTIFNNLPDFNTICYGLMRDNYCLLTIAEQLVCADAVSTLSTNKSKQVLYDIFYKHYFESPVSSKMPTVENQMKLPPYQQVADGTKLDEYGYFVYKIETKTQQGLGTHSRAQMMDSYYFIYILSKIIDE